MLFIKTIDDKIFNFLPKGCFLLICLILIFYVHHLFLKLDIFFVQFLEFVLIAHACIEVFNFLWFSGWSSVVSCFVCLLFFVLAPLWWFLWNVMQVYFRAKYLSDCIIELFPIFIKKSKFSFGNKVISHLIKA